MAVTTTPRAQITRWSDPTDPFTRAQMDASHASIEALMAIDVQDLLSARPAPGTRGRFFTEAAASAGLPGTTWRDDGATWRSVGSRITAASSSDIGQVVRGAASQAADLTSWQNSAGSGLAHMSPSGELFASGVYASGGYLSARLSAAALTATDKVAVFRGASGQTADLGQFQDSAGALLSSIDKSGIYNVSGVAYVGANVDPTTLLRARAGTQRALLLQGAGSQSTDVAQWTDSVGVVGGGVTSQQFFYVGPNSPGGMVGVQIPTASPAFRGVVVKAAPSQSGDLYSSYDSAGNLTGRWTAAGGFHGRYDAGMLSGSLPATANSMSQAATNNWGLVVKKFPAAVTDVFGVVDDTNSIMFSVRADGLTGNAANGNYFNAPSSFGAVALLSPKATGQSALYLRSFLGQAADLQQWQNSSNIALSSMSAAGQLWASGGALFTPIGAAVPTSGGFAPQVGVISGSSSTPTLLLKGATSQSQDLLVAQDPAGALLGKISSAGGITMNGGGNNSFGPGAPTTARVNIAAAGSGSTVGLLVLGASGQSQNLTTWQNSTPATVAAVTSTGNVQGTGAYTTLSDARVKENVEDLPLDPLHVVRRLRPVHFDYVGGERDQVGFVAQDVEAVLPAAVIPFDRLAGGIPDVDGRLGLRDGAILAYLVAAVQRIDSRVSVLERAA
jgi:hypothetical protein